MGCNTTYYFQLADGTILATFTFMFGYCNMGKIVEIMGKRYEVDDVKEFGEIDDDKVVKITMSPSKL